MSYLFTLYPSTSFLYAPYAFGFVALLLIGSFGLEYCRKRIIKNTSLRKALKKLPTAMWIIAVVALIMTLARLAGIPMVSMRVWWLVLLAVMFFLLYRTFVKYKQTELVKEHFVKRVENTHKVDKYLPKKKKK